MSKEPVVTLQMIYDLALGVHAMLLRQEIVLNEILLDMRRLSKTMARPITKANPAAPG